MKNQSSWFCSSGCYNKNRPPKVLNVCKVCEGKLDRKSAIYCSRTCYYEDMSGPNNPNWKSSQGKYYTKDGYVTVRVKEYDPMYSMSYKGKILEHRYVMANSIGRPLLAEETVHHINGIRDDNRLENLQLRQGNHGSGVVRVCGDCGSSNVINGKI